MRTSSSIAALVTALCAFQKRNIIIPRGSEAGGRGSRKWKYASLDDILEIVRPFLSEHGLVLIQALGPGQFLTTTLAHTSGEWISESFDLVDMIALTTAFESGRNGGAAPPQAVGMVVTYARRYAVGAILGLATDEDTDGALTPPARNETQQAQPRVQGVRGGSTKSVQDAPKHPLASMKRGEIIKSVNVAGKKFYLEHWNEGPQGAKSTMASQTSDGRVDEFKKLKNDELVKLYDWLRNNVEEYGDYEAKRGTERDRGAVEDY